jgi:hypothetical protein
MIEGTLDIFWGNHPADPRIYRMSFLPYSANPEHGAIVRKQVAGNDALFSYLVSIQVPSMEAERREERARKWMREVHGKTSVSLPNVILTEQQASEFSRAAAASN